MLVDTDQARDDVLETLMMTRRPTHDISLRQVY